MAEQAPADVLVGGVGTFGGTSFVIPVYAGHRPLALRQAERAPFGVYAVDSGSF